jgi:DNA-directed RNA polymerase subunit RPC12/RpoP
VIIWESVIGICEVCGREFLDTPSVVFNGDGEEMPDYHVRCPECDDAFWDALYENERG